MKLWELHSSEKAGFDNGGGGMHPPTPFRGRVFTTLPLVVKTMTYKGLLRWYWGFTTDTNTTEVFL